MLSSEHTNKIREDIDQSNISIKSLKEDLLDHFCCFVEEEMKRGTSFQDAYQEAIKQICPNGLDEIQRETVLLLNSKKTMIMKKTLYFIGFCSSMSMSLGFLLRISHMPGGAELADYGLLAFAFLFLPMLAIFRYKNTFGRIIWGRLTFILGFGCAMLLAISVFLKMQTMHDIGNMLMTIGILLFTFGYLPSLFFRMYKKSLN